MGSVKDLIVLKLPEREISGIGRFIFSDRYSVFDWGEMPDHIEDKGKSICISTSYFFEKLEENGIKTHYLGVVENGNIKKLSEIKNPPNTIEFKMLRVLKPEIKNNFYDYSIYKKEKANFLIPLEVIYRNYLPEGSSIFKRLKEGSLKLKDIGLERMPSVGEKLEKPIIDISTKLELTDRYISWNEAKEIAGLTDEEIEEIKLKTLKINEIITKEVEKKGRIKKMLMNFGKVVEDKFDNPDLILTIGGDGTILKAIGLLKNKKTLIYGIKYGKIGFLTNQVENLEEKIKRILIDGKFKVSKRMLLEVNIKRREKKIYKDRVLNDFLITRRGIRIIEIEVFADDEKIMNFRGDGIIISTPTGSTAHSLSSGGPIINPEFDSILITPVSPYTLSIRPVILPPDKRLKIKVSPEGKIISDGQREFNFEKGHSIEIKKSKIKANLIIEEDFFEKLFKVFNFGK